MQSRSAFSFFRLAGAAAGLWLAPACARKDYFQKDARLDPAGPLAAAADSVHGVAAGRHYARHGALYCALVGRHYRSTWAVPVSAPVFQLARARPGGLRLGKIGGGFNSTSVGLEASNGQGFVLRTVDKDPIRATPRVLRNTFLVNALRDNVSSTNPYAALAVPLLAEAVGVAHSSPQLFYVRPDDAAFRNDSLRHFPGQLAFLEEKVAVLPGRATQLPLEVLGSKKAFAGVFASSRLQVEQAALLRARLLDAWLGDWDRHAGQWSWAVVPGAGSNNLQLLPLPKDRDMVFYRLDDGVLGWVLGHVAQRHWVTFGPRFGNARDLFSSGRYLDTRALNGLTRAQFLTVARAMQQHLPDALLEKAVRQLPAAAFALEGPRLVAELRARRAALPALAERFYRQLARHPVVGGTAQAELFEIHRYADSTLVVVRPAAPAGALPFYRRAFLAAETRTVQLEGLGGDDVFLLEEHAGGLTRPAIRVYGGGGHDELRAAAGSKGLRYTPGPAPAERAYDKGPKE